MNIRISLSVPTSKPAGDWTGVILTLQINRAKCYQPSKSVLKQILGPTATQLIQPVRVSSVLSGASPHTAWWWKDGVRNSDFGLRESLKCLLRGQKVELPAVRFDIRLLWLYHSYRKLQSDDGCGSPYQVDLRVLPRFDKYLLPACSCDVVLGTQVRHTPASAVFPPGTFHQTENLVYGIYSGVFEFL